MTITKNKKILYSIVAILVLLIGFAVWIAVSPKNISNNNTANVGDTETLAPTPTPKLYGYIEIHDACDWDHRGACVNMRKGPGKQYDVKLALRDGIVLKVKDQKEADGLIWYRIAFGNELRYPERVEEDLYVAAGESVRYFEDEGRIDTSRANASSTKRIVVDVSDQTLYAFDGDDFFMQEKISTGLEFTPTPRGKFFILRKTPERYMQGPIPALSDQYYDLPGVPWDLYFTRNGDVIHGAYWHDNFGKQWSHGCVNLPLEQAHKLYTWAEVGMPVMVQD